MGATSHPNLELLSSLYILLCGNSEDKINCDEQILLVTTEKSTEPLRVLL